LNLNESRKKDENLINEKRIEKQGKMNQSFLGDVLHVNLLLIKHAKEKFLSFSESTWKCSY
jgi:hypothetical protein